MRNIRIILLLAIGALAQITVYAQSWPQQMYQGKMCYVYTVEPGNTLYGISKSFSADMNAILALNPETRDGLNIGQVVYIPFDSIDKREAKKSDVRLDGEYIMHTVQRRETLFSIARSYNVTLAELMDANPRAELTLAVGTVLKVPAYSSKDVEGILLEPARNDTFLIHQVQKGETGFSLARMYGVTIDSLASANKGIKDGLREGQWVIIPRYNETYLAKLKERQDADSDSRIPSGKREAYNMAIMMPFELNLSDSLQRSVMLGKEMPLLTEIALEFYRGAQIALDSLEKLGFSANVYVYDVGEDVLDARQVMRRPEMKDMHIVFGPLHKGSLAVVSEAARNNFTWVVSPNSFANELFEDNPMLFRAAASKETQLRYLANYVAINHRQQNVVVVNSDRNNDVPLRELFKQYYREALTTHKNIIRDTVLVVTRRAFDGEAIHSTLRKNTTNILVVPSNELAFVSDFMTRLSRLREEGYEVQVYGLDQWVKFDNIEAEYKNRFRLKLAVPSFVEYDQAATIDFLRKYRLRYETEPHKMNYGFLGYDLVMFFGKAMLDGGVSFTDRLQQMSLDGTAGRYRFGRTAGSDYENKSVSIIEYRDFDVKRIN